MDGPVGDMVKAQNRHGFRPSHIHFLIGGEGYRELVTALYFGDDEHIDSDTVFGVSGSLVVSAAEDPNSPVPGMRAVHYDFRLAAAAPGEVGPCRRGSDQDDAGGGVKANLSRAGARERACHRA